MPVSPAKIVSARRNGKRGGRPEKHLDKIKVVSNLVAEGFSWDHIAKTLNISKDTLWRWRSTSRRLSDAIKKAQAVLTLRVEDSLVSRALGMTLPDFHVSQYKGKVTVTPLTKHLAPDTLACIFYLKNRAPERWADRQDVRVQQTAADLPEAVVERIRALARAKSSGGMKPIEVQEVKQLPQAKEHYWNYDGV
jgi:DNA-binding transcriptional regulator YiaG